MAPKADNKSRKYRRARHKPQARDDPTPQICSHCGSNLWCNQRVVKLVMTLKCCACGENKKLDKSRVWYEWKCVEFHKNAECSLGEECTKMHIYYSKVLALEKSSTASPVSQASDEDSQECSSHYDSAACGESISSVVKLQPTIPMAPSTQMCDTIFPEAEQPVCPDVYQPETVPQYSGSESPTSQPHSYSYDSCVECLPVCQLHAPMPTQCRCSTCQAAPQVPAQSSDSDSLTSHHRSVYYDSCADNQPLQPFQTTPTQLTESMTPPLVCQPISVTTHSPYGVGLMAPSGSEFMNQLPVVDNRLPETDDKEEELSDDMSMMLIAVN